MASSNSATQKAEALLLLSGRSLPRCGNGSESWLGSLGQRSTGRSRSSPAANGEKNSVALPGSPPLETGPSRGGVAPIGTSSGKACTGTSSHGSDRLRCFSTHRASHTLHRARPWSTTDPEVRNAELLNGPNKSYSHIHLRVRESVSPQSSRSHPTTYALSMGPYCPQDSQSSRSHRPCHVRRPVAVISQSHLFSRNRWPWVFLSASGSQS